MQLLHFISLLRRSFKRKTAREILPAPPQYTFPGGETEAESAQPEEQGRLGPAPTHPGWATLAPECALVGTPVDEGTRWGPGQRAWAKGVCLFGHVCVCVCVFTGVHMCGCAPAARRGVGTHVYPGGTPAARIALQREAGQSRQAPAWGLRGQPSYHCWVPPAGPHEPSCQQGGW